MFIDSKLQQTMTDLKKLIEASRNGAISVDTHGEYVKASDYWADLNGLRRMYDVPPRLSLYTTGKWDSFVGAGAHLSWLDHTMVFHGQNGWVIVSHPYQRPPEAALTVIRAFDIPVQVLDTEESWYYPGSTYCVIIGDC